MCSELVTVLFVLRMYLIIVGILQPSMASILYLMSSIILYLRRVILIFSLVVLHFEYMMSIRQTSSSKSHLNFSNIGILMSFQAILSEQRELNYGPWLLMTVERRIKVREDIRSLVCSLRQRSRAFLTLPLLGWSLSIYLIKYCIEESYSTNLGR